MVYIFLAEGFEEIEALTQIDLLKRAGVDVCSVGVVGSTICGAHGIKVQCDTTIEAAQLDDANMLILPGGMPGVTNLYESEMLLDAVADAYKSGKFVAAICAAPLILGRLGILNGKEAICYPGFEDELSGAALSQCDVARDGNVITAKAAGTAIDFAAELITVLKGRDAANKVLSGIYYEK